MTLSNPENIITLHVHLKLDDYRGMQKRAIGWGMRVIITIIDGWAIHMVGAKDQALPYLSGIYTTRDFVSKKLQHHQNCRK